MQTAASVPPERLYQAYRYRSGLNATMRDHLAGIAEEAMALAGVEAPTVLDIGCNDGTLLSHFPAGSARFGVDPSDVAAMAMAEGGITLVPSFFPSDAALAGLGGLRFDAVTSVAMFYDLKDPVMAARAVAGLLAPDGVWILELSYLPLMLLQNAFDTICHEHLEYYSLAVLEHIAAAAGLRIFRAAINGMNGGSIRCFVCHDGNTRLGTPGDRAFLDALRAREHGMGLGGARPYHAFQARAEALRDELTRRLREIRASGERIHVYGASTKGNVLLQWCGIDGSLVDCAADRNPAKVGASTPGTGIPIRSEAESRALKPDWYLVLPWHFRQEFLERERATIMAGTKLLFPLPRIGVVDAETYDAARAERPDYAALLGLASPG
ncbi:class I SAM-dependent methyltransferase [Azospirillum picis]|uniref:NDP-4-keto-2,6-dideoxyhexose 3-C-methyltransferase n=1 Tax=Azospirillum picis TaxID=488438 RepID=A0ABU0MSM8_9PROT|nr:class I SAM-dependent methyltransferase [Azospirillum picis]MBP2302744.1 NDP-4-keto-2,6-dideoxyhexose 3-C-methyltransferase [Azospirillum picis]MDQ0536495.1 NDP-4-keto-2,6-dideoxyhexose 3-C-methyltransferase [Azospirillum picis]